VQAQIVQKERWETRVVRRRDERAGQAAHGAGGAAYLTDNVDEEYKVSGLVGAEAEHKRMDQLVQIRRKLLGEIE
jgi:hypothetical protein